MEGCASSTPKYWYNESFDPAPNTTITISAATLGANPIWILDSDSDKINISIAYCTPARFDHYMAEDHLNITASAIYANDWTQGVGADIYVYLPGNVNYTVIVKNLAATDSPNNIYKKGSQTTVRYTKGNITVLPEKY